MCGVTHNILLILLEQKSNCLQEEERTHQGIDYQDVSKKLLKIFARLVMLGNSLK